MSFRHYLSCRWVVGALLTTLLICPKAVRGEDEVFAQGHWTHWKKSKKWAELTTRFVSDGLDAERHVYRMRVAFRNDTSTPVIITYRGRNADGSSYSEQEFADAGEVVEPKDRLGKNPKVIPVEITSVVSPRVRN